jgi:alkanesulfonate monooxygenase SsuD/methylene tetrahydromethanopterin reductase-like flavin-dependent oxidoreductase (luciferase family)
VKFYGFHLMPYRHLTRQQIDDSPTRWVTFSNSHFDAERAADLYEEYLDELCYYDSNGFDGVCVNEHHQTAYGLMPSPNLMAAMLIPRVKGKIAILGNALSLRTHPLQVAEEVAMLDVMSHGRILCGFVRGIGGEYYNFDQDPSQSRDRFYEAHDLIIKAWTEPGPFEWYGKYFKQRYVNPWPLPYQKPHPPIWSPSQGSGETVDWAAKNRYTYCQTLSDVATVKRVFGDFRDACRSYGYEAHPEQMSYSVPIYVADTDEEAMREAKPHMMSYFNDFLKMPPDMLFPAGYLTVESATRVMASRKGLGNQQVFEELVEKGTILVGSHDTVRERLESMHQAAGFGAMAPYFQFGSMPPELFRKSVSIFSDKVMPALRPLGESLAPLGS